MDDNIKEHIIDYTVGDADYWRLNFNQCLDEIRELNGVKLVKHFFLEYKGWEDWSMSLNNMFAHLVNHKFKHLVLMNVVKVLNKSRWWWSDRFNQFGHHPDCDDLIHKIELTMPEN